MEKGINKVQLVKTRFLLVIIMPQRIDDFNRIETLQHSLKVIKDKIQDINKENPLYNSWLKKHKQLPDLKNAQKEIEEELKVLKSELYDYIDRISQNPSYSFCDKLYRQVFIEHYIKGKTWKQALKDSGSKKEVKNFKRDIYDKLIILDYCEF